MRLIKAGTVDQSVMIRFMDSTDGSPETGVVTATAGLAVTYRKTGAAAVVLNSGSTPAINDLAALTTAHTDAGLKHIADGWYRFDLPDDAVSAGVTCLVSCTATGMVGFGTVLQLVSFDPQSAVTLGLTNLDAKVSDAVAAPAAALVAVNLDHLVGTAVGIPALPANTFLAGPLSANLTQILGATVTGTAAQIVAAFTKWFNVATPTGTVNSLPDAVAGAVGGLAIVGSAMAVPTDQAVNVTKWSGVAVTAPAVAGSPVVTLGATQAAYAPAKAGDKMDLVDAPSATGAAALGLAFWHVLAASVVTLNSIGLQIKTALDAAISTRSTYAGADTPGTGTLLGRILGTLDTGTHKPQSGDAYAIVSGADGNAAILTAVNAIDAAAIDAQLSGTHGAGGLPLAGVYCRLTTDQAGQNNIDAGTTNGLGEVTFHHDLPAGTTVYIWRSCTGYAFSPDPDQETV